MTPKESSHRVAIATVLMALCGFPLRAERQREGKVEPIDGVEATGFHAPEDGIVWSTPGLGHPDARYQRLHLSEISGVDPALPFDLEVRDQKGELVETISSKTLSSKVEYWTGVVQGPLVVLKIRAGAPPVGVHFKVDKLAWGRDPGAELSIIGPDRREQIYQVQDPAILAAARAVAKLSLIIDGETASCTGFMISSRRMLTNEHCIDSQAICNDAVAVFDFQRKNATTLLQGKSFHCSRFVDARPDLDWALIELAGDPGNEYGWLQLTPRAVSKGEKLVLIQHPGGDPKDISRRGCRVKTKEAAGVTAALTDFGHECDTKKGSSGSPVVDLQMRVVGLHHYSKAAAGEPFHDQNRAVRTQSFLPTLPTIEPGPGVNHE